MSEKFLLLANLTLQCTEEAHRPVDCGTVAKWILKNSAESENMNWFETRSLFLLSFPVICKFAC